MVVNRRLVATSDDEDEALLPRPQSKQLRKRLKLLEEDEEEEEEEEKEEPPLAVEDAKPIGDPVRVSGKGRGRKKHFHSFEFDGNQYTLEDPVLLVPEDEEQKPYVAIIKDITQSLNGNVMVTGQWFYRPEEAPKKGGGSWKSRDTRELFYSFHRDEVPAESVMHKCVVHFVPIHKQLPKRKEHPGFIIQKVYDTVERKLWKLTDKDYEDNNQQEIDVLVEKTLQRIGKQLLDVETEEAPADQKEYLIKTKRSLKRKSISPLDVSREEEGTPKGGDQHLKPETPGSCVNTASEHYRVLQNFKALTGDIHRDKWLERLLQHIQYACHSDDTIERDHKGLRNVNSNEINNAGNNRSSELANDCQVKAEKSFKCFIWPDAAVPAIVALEKASHDALSSDFHKYNQKLRQLAFNLKKNALLAHRLLNGELEPSRMLNMTSNELKEGLAAVEINKKERDESQHMQMTDARCPICMDRKVGVRNIIRAGPADRYELECVVCGNSWFASRDEVSLLTIDGSDSKRSIGTEPLATSKLVAGEKKLVSPRESDKSASDILKKTSEVVPVLDAQKSFGKSRRDDNTEATGLAD